MTKHKAILLSTAYFAPVSYFSKLASFSDIYIEQHEHFIKQTYRNRAIILGANGPVALVVPVEKGREQKIKIKDLRISYDEKWQRTHWRTIFSAYNSSPFFEYYADDLQPFFSKKAAFLLDYNLQITETISELLEIPFEPRLTNGFEELPIDAFNFREKLTPKPHRNFDDPDFIPQPYTQVFSEKFGFTPNLSILDLLFNEGPTSHTILLNCIP